MLTVSVAFRAREWARTRNVQQLVFSLLFNGFFLFQPRYVLSYACNVDPAIKRLESDGLRYLVVISADFGRKQIYVETYRYSTYFLPLHELALDVFCISEILFIFGAFENIQVYRKPYEVGVSGCVSERCPQDDEGV